VTLNAASRLLTTPGQIEDADFKGPLEHTGYWGKRCAGCIILSSSSNKFLLPLRSPEVDDPNCWGTWGGAIDGNENPATSVRRETREENGYTGVSRLYPLLVFSNPDSGMVYHNYLMIVPEEFEPALNWETSKAEWFDWGSFPEPMHSGLQALLDDRWSVDTIEHHMNLHFGG
jgi:8-oxo-dGTP pyrophosphatase MutT (NUDIX family)